MEGSAGTENIESPVEKGAIPSEGTLVNPDQTPDLQKEAQSKEFEIWSDETTRIYYPENPLVPSGEGIHLRVESANVPLHPKNPEEWKAWLSHWAKTIGV